MKYTLLNLLCIICIFPLWSQTGDSYLAVYRSIPKNIDADFFQMELHFNANESFFLSEKKMYKDSGEELKYKILMAANKSESAYYSNINEDYIYSPFKHINQYSKISKPKSDLKWKIDFSKSKMINDYLCLFAESEITDDCHFSIEKGTKITVWFTPDVPSRWGPFGLHGLPGLVVEITLGNYPKFGLTSIKKIPSLKVTIPHKDSDDCLNFTVLLKKQSDEAARFKNENKEVIDRYTKKPKN